MIGHWFWFGLTMACVIWYSLITLYVAVRGAFDIRTMLSHLDSRRIDEDK